MAAMNWQTLMIAHCVTLLYPERTV